MSVAVRLELTEDDVTRGVWLAERAVYTFIYPPESDPGAAMLVGLLAALDDTEYVDDEGEEMTIGYAGTLAELAEDLERTNYAKLVPKAPAGYQTRPVTIRILY